ncbi:hypothetical protein OXYTRIMIC_416 [Oxytricha trifallax]|uniref:Uncharacterized protein n=1 Tax=Oxytricha trifallax TaxID=1172189 RepID=A0A073HWQ2_9SPIT|nr:hypothetical protein OXYTRIMIC_416 [Oxytricha trifallax]
MWAVKNNINKGNSQFQDKKQQWNEAIRDMEHCLDRNDLKGFFYLVKRLTKNQKQSQPIKGLTINEERVQPGNRLQNQQLNSTKVYLQMRGLKTNQQKMQQTSQ